ncbi:amidohydrolase family protein [Haloterrigena alkaliphila]|uniref:Amidohydrolase n=1 Tax=Haloterrigena alkaliphila TaxID=2816475 RepID=A0A8A2VC12_9EURY|nr:amidohydrolase family protein [Haloterrigena alkaliphila]QSW97715.1 amidohydrolase [Haloterrigena alkaliphila]
MIDPSEHLVVDCDWHYADTFEQAAPYMPEPWKTKFQKSGWGGTGVKQNLSAFFPASTGNRFNYGKVDREFSEYPDGGDEKEDVLEGMDQLDIDATLQISHLILAMGGVRADDRRVESFVKGHVDYMLDQVLDPDEGIYGLAPMPYHDIEASMDVLDRVEDEEAIKGVVFVTAGASPPLGNRKYDPIYERCEDLGLPVVYHTGGSGLDEYVRAGYQDMIETHTLGFLESNMSQIVSVTAQGVPVKFPDLDIVFMESGVTYLPGLISRLNEEYLKRSEEAPLLEKKPGEYIADYYYGTQPLEVSARPDLLELCFDMLGTENLLYASDYPHWDFDSPSIITDLPMIDDDDRLDILGRNAAGVFDL